RLRRRRKRQPGFAIPTHRGCLAYKHNLQQMFGLGKGYFRGFREGPRQHGPERLAAMADAELLLGGNFAESATEGRIVEERIVAETGRSAGGPRDEPFNYTVEHAPEAAGFH